MAQLTAKKNRGVFLTEPRYANRLPVKASTKIYDGSLVGLASGLARQLVAGDAFGGLAADTADNSAGGDSAIGVEVISEFLIEVDVTGVTAVSDVGSTVYASDGNSFTLTSTSNTTVGVVHRWISGTKCVVHCKAATLK